MRLEADATLATCMPLRRPWGILQLRIAGCDLGRAARGEVPILDSHQIRPLGHLVSAQIEEGAFRILGRLRFDASDLGLRAFEMIERAEVGGISCGFSISEWSALDADDDEIDDDESLERYYDDPHVTFVAQRFELLEVSVTSLPADPCARIVRSLGDEVWHARRRMLERQRQAQGKLPFADDDNAGRRIYVPPPEMIQHASPERFP
jgi:phage head maturation protease